MKIWMFITCVSLLAKAQTHAFYNPNTGRWLSRDPIEEQGGINLFGFISNRPISDYDIDGRCYPLYDECGPDVTRATLLTLAEVRRTFLHQWDKAQRHTACNELYNWGHGGAGQAWDIAELAFVGFWREGQPLPKIDGIVCGTGNCIRTVTFMGNCYYASAVNYVLWGTANRLCNGEFGDRTLEPVFQKYSLENALIWAALRKSAIWNGGDGLEEAQALAFTAYGWAYRLPPIKSRSDCKVDRSKRSRQNRPFDWIWRPNRGGYAAR
jgi:hypothetical protein